MNQTENKPPAALVVDDDEADLLYFQNSLQNQGFRVASAMTAEDAVRELSRGGWDVIILDWMLPQMTGIELLGKLKNNPSWRDIPVILVTAKAGSGALDKGLTAGARD
ncbi:MAG: response regulator, partial [Nitrospinota bacterium]|nr:response regulator [Nitrospinota bacterium]